MKKLFLLVITVVTLVFTAFAQAQLTANTLKLEEGKKGKSASIGDMKWLAGTWQGEGLGGYVEEIYSEPKDKTMMGMFRFLENDKTLFYELITISENNDTLVVNLKHFNRDLTGWEERLQIVSFPFVKKEKNRYYFVGMTFEVINKDQMNVYVAINKNEGSSREEVFRYKRRK